MSASKFITGFNNFNLLQTNNKTVSSSLGLVNSSGYSVSFTEEKIVIIPPKSSKYVMEYSINNTVYKDCDLFKYPTKNK